MFCDICNKDVVAYKKRLIREISVRGVLVKAPYFGAICPSCCHELYDDEIEDEIITTAKQIYRRKERLLDGSSVASFMKKKHLSAEDFAKKLQCSTQELIMATHGGLQSKELDDKIRHYMKHSA